MSLFLQHAILAAVSGTFAVAVGAFLNRKISSGNDAVARVEVLVNGRLEKALTQIESLEAQLKEKP